MVLGMKMTEYFRQSKILTIYLMGTNSWPPNQNTKKYRHQIREAVLTNSGLGAWAIQHVEVGEAVVAGYIQEAGRRAMQLSYGHLRYEKAVVF